ncbi:MAG: DNA polymerase III subunit beta [Bacilli bacterium]|nr:DNA polymerase III subunit beta [Bacilli bacterium]
MKFSIKKDVLLQNLTAVSKALSSKNLIPILSGIKFNLTSEGLFLSASDNDISIESFIDKDKLEAVDEVGNTVIQGKYVLEIIRKLEGRVVNIELLDGIKVLISCGNSEFNLNCMDASEFPNLNIEEKKEPVIIKKEEFKNLINKTSFAISTQETRPILTGINFKINNDKLECIATDSYRLAKKYVTLPETINEDVNIVIPGRNLIELTKILEENNNDIEMHVFTNKVLFKFDNTLFQTRVLSGTFPDVDRLIPATFELEIKANANEFFNVIDRAALLTSEKDKNIVKFECEQNEVIVSSNSPEIGRVEEKINVEKDSEKSIKIAFSSRFMMDALKTIESRNVVLKFNNDVQPIIILDDKDQTLLQLILPIKTY